MFSLAHLSDPHLPLPPAGAPILGLTGKQLLSRLAWQHKRRRITSEAVLDALAADLAVHAPDHIAVTGDLVNLATRLEIASAGGWLALLGPSEKVSVVPGNHDRLIRSADLSGWAPWMGCARQEPAFPTLARRKEVAIIGLSSACPTPISMASGRLGAAQLERTAAMLAQAKADGLFSVVLVHHPPVPAAGGLRKALRDRAALAGILRRHGAELVLHGHHHRARLTSLPGPSGAIPVIGVPSASAGMARPEPAGWNLHRITRGSPGWRLVTVARRYRTTTGRFEQAGEWSMDLDIQ